MTAQPKPIDQPLEFLTIAKAPPAATSRATTSGTASSTARFRRFGPGSAFRVRAADLTAYFARFSAIDG